MNKRVKKLWIKALKSGKYKENVHGYCMRRGDTYDPLGVLCDLHRKQVRKKGWMRIGQANKMVDPFTIYSYRSHTTELPSCVLKWADLPILTPMSAIVYAVYKGKPTTIAGLFDYRKLSFEQMADIIEKQL